MQILCDKSAVDGLDDQVFYNGPLPAGPELETGNSFFDNCLRNGLAYRFFQNLIVFKHRMLKDFFYLQLNLSNDALEAMSSCSSETEFETVGFFFRFFLKF